MVFLAKGQNGIIFKPIIECNTKLHGLDKNKEYISKIFFNQKSCDYEWTASKIIKELDPEHIFTLKHVKKCKINNNKMLLDFFPKKKKLAMMIIEYGGIDLDLSKTIKFSLKHFIELLNGINILNKNNLCHFDIKPTNILINSNNEFKIIDFGEMIKFKEYKDIYKYITIDEDHPFYPPEISVLSNKKNKHLFRKENIKFLDKYSKKDDLLLASKFDIYGLGKTFEQIFYKLKFNKKSDEIFLKKLISYMTEINPYERFTIKQCIQYINKYLKSTKTKSKRKSPKRKTKSSKRKSPKTKSKRKSPKRKSKKSKRKSKRKNTKRKSKRKSTKRKSKSSKRKSPKENQKK